eukprot:g5370.t1
MEFKARNMHESLCPHVDVECPLASIGCAERPARGLLNEHIKEAIVQYSLLTGKKLVSDNSDLVTKCKKLASDNKKMRDQIKALRTGPSLLEPIDVMFEYVSSKDAYQQEVTLFGEDFGFCLDISRDCTHWQVGLLRLRLKECEETYGNVFDRGQLQVWIPTSKQQATKRLESLVQAISFGPVTFDESSATKRRPQKKICILGTIPHAKFLQSGAKKFIFNINGCVAKSVHLPEPENFKKPSPAGKTEVLQVT